MRARENPFRMDRLEQVRYRPQGTTWGAILARLEALRWRAAVVGPEGSGKTTFLEDLAGILRGQGFEVRYLRCHGAGGRPRAQPDPVRARLPERANGLLSGADLQVCATNRTRAGGPRHEARTDLIVLLDDADALGLLGWWRARWAARGARGLVIATHGEGRLPTLLRTTTSADLLADVVRTVAPAEAAHLEPRLATLHARHGGNLRAALREIYDWYSEAAGCRL